mgnify:CR=1 FL=1
MSEWLPLLNIAINVLLFPLLKLVWDMRSDIVRLTEQIKNQNGRIGRLEDNCDARHG